MRRLLEENAAEFLYDRSDVGAFLGELTLAESGSHGVGEQWRRSRCIGQPLEELGNAIYQ